jgi:hypothetical protein
MGVKRFRALLERSEYRQNDKKFSPLWVGRYAESVKAENGRLPVTVEFVRRVEKN